MLGGQCSPCCCPCADSLPCSDPVDEGTWSPPPGEWADIEAQSGVVRHGAGPLGANWAFATREEAGPGSTWFFFGWPGTSRPGGGASTQEQQDWGNLCNWYSVKTTAPEAGRGSIGSLVPPLVRRATRLPDENATVHIYTTVSTASVGPQTVRRAYFWASLGELGIATTTDFDITCTGTIEGITSASCGALFYNSANLGRVSGGAAFMGTFFSLLIDTGLSISNGGNATAPNYDNSTGEIVGDALFCGNALNLATVTGTSHFYGRLARNDARTFAPVGIGTVSNGAVFWNGLNLGTVNGGAVFRGWPDNSGFFGGGNGSTRRGVVNGGALFLDGSGNGGDVYGGAVFRDTSENGGSLSAARVFGGAVFEGSSVNGSAVFGGAQFFGNSRNTGPFGEVTGGATFNDDACSTRVVIFDGVPKFAAHPTELPICSGTAPPRSATPTPTCGCG